MHQPASTDPTTGHWSIDGQFFDLCRLGLRISCGQDFSMVSNHRRLPIDGASLHKWHVQSSVHWVRNLKMGSYLPNIYSRRRLLPTDHRPGHEPSFFILGGTTLGNFGHQHGSFLKDPWIILGDIFLDFSNLNMFVYMFRT